MSKKYNILIVDDEEQIASIIKKYLAFYIHFDRIVIAKDGVQAMQKLSNQEFDLVITDLVMPKRDGFALIDNIKKMPKYYNLKIMIVSGCLSRESTIMAMRKGVRYIVTKPFTARQLLQKVFSILKVDKDPVAFTDKLMLKIAERIQEKKKQIDAIAQIDKIDIEKD